MKRAPYLLLALMFAGCYLDTSGIRAMDDREQIADAIESHDGAPAVDANDVSEIPTADVVDVVPASDASCPSQCPALQTCRDPAWGCCRELCGADCNNCNAGDHCQPIAGGCVLCCGS